MSIAMSGNKIKLWNTNKWECLLNITNITINKDSFIISTCLLNNNVKLCILASSFNFFWNFERIKVYNLIGNKIKEIENSNEGTLFIDIYYDYKASKNYL